MRVVQCCCLIWRSRDRGASQARSVTTVRVPGWPSSSRLSQMEQSRINHHHRPKVAGPQTLTGAMPSRSLARRDTNDQNLSLRTFLSVLAQGYKCNCETKKVVFCCCIGCLTLSSMFQLKFPLVLKPQNRSHSPWNGCSWCDDMNCCLGSVSALRSPLQADFTGGRRDVMSPARRARAGGSHLDGHQPTGHKSDCNQQM